MTKQSTAQPETQTPPAPDDPFAAGRNLYEREIQSFGTFVESKSLEAGFRRFGFALFHSLPTEKRLLYAEQIGLECKDAASLYNLGLAHANSGNFERAIEYWKKALNQDGELADAEFNQALAYERLQDLAQARKHFAKYLKMIDDPEDVQAVEEHLAELGS